ncbi:MAG TPA: zinc ribbon domain-containing protein [Candidatus Onthovivens sp.]|nr:zinc ribbon domain-containing protein [Candidatus Onthovivens sp.]
MYCKKCGAEISEDTKFCPGCGTNLKAAPEKVVEPKKNNEENENDIFSIIFGVLSIVLASPIGLVLGIIGLSKKSKYKVISIIGVVLSTLATIYLIITLIFIIYAAQNAGHIVFWPPFDQIPY